MAANPNLKNFTDITKRILQPTSFGIRKLETRDIMTFWETQLYDKQTVYWYICELIKQISSFEKDKKISNAIHTISLENLQCTLFVVSMFREFDKKNELTTFRADKECAFLQRSAALTMVCPHSVSIVENFFQIHSDASEPHFLSNLIGQICCFPDLTKQNLDTFNQESHINQHLQSYYKQLEKYTHMIQEESSTHYSMLLLPENQLQETGEFAYTYEYFLKFMRLKKRFVPRVVFDIIVRYFKVLPQIAKEFPDQAEKSILCLLHLTKQIITYFGVRENESIRTVLSQVQVFRRWPYPVGNLAQELVTILFKEKKLNGNAFRYKVREEIPLVDVEHPKQMYQQQSENQMYRNEESHMFHQTINMPIGHHQHHNQHEQGGDSRGLYKAHIICEKDQSEVHYIWKLSRLLVKESRISSEHILRTALVANMLSLSANTHPDHDIPGIISKKKPSEVFLIYCQLLRIFEKWDKLDDLVDIQLLQKDQFGKIINLLPSQNDDQVNHEAIHTILSENQTTFIPEFPYPELKPTVKFAWPGLKQSTSKVHNTVTQQVDDNLMHNLYFPLILEADSKRFTQQGQFQEQFCREFFDLETVKNFPQYQEPHRFIVMGGDAELHGLVQILGEFFEKNEINEMNKNKKTERYDSKLMNQLDLRVFIVPTKKNTLAHYLASKDVWYQRYLYLPFREDLILPKLDKSEETTDKAFFESTKFEGVDKNAVPMLPQELRLQVLHSYVREANRSFNVRIYKAHCTFRNDSTCMIYFCQYLEIGESVQAEIINRQKTLKKGESHPSLYEMKEKNMIRFNGVDLSMKFQSVDYLGNKWKEEEYKESFSNIKVNNVYKEYFEGNTPFPNSHWLEFTCITQENAKLFDSNLRNKHLFRKNAKDPMSGADQVQAAFKALFTSIPIETISIEADAKQEQKTGQQSFSILIDGKIFNDIKKVVVGPVYQKDPIDPKKDNPHIFLSLPVMTFLPLKL